MQLINLKAAKDVALEGLVAEFEKVDGSLKRVKLRDAKGREVIFAMDGYYSFQVLAEAPPKMVKRFALTGTVLGIDIALTFEHEHEAKQRKSELEDNVVGACVLKLEPVEAPEEGE